MQAPQKHAMTSKSEGADKSASAWKTPKWWTNLKKNFPYNLGTF